jgi:GH25 family lysozyme M1 (1,4-beta-N-acetylmuramidase)
LLLLPDLSEFQAGADLEGIKDMNGGAAIIRAAYGADHPDKAFARLRAGAADFAFLGIYQYLVVGQDATAQAEAFCKITGKLAPHEVPILDLEEGSGDQAVRAAVWLTHVDAALGLAPGPVQQRSWVYSGMDFAQTHGLVPVFDGPRHTWVAAYGPAEPKLGHTLWQCTDGTSGIHVTDWPGAGRCDTNVFNGTLAQLCARAGLPRH